MTTLKQAQVEKRYKFSNVSLSVLHDPEYPAMSDSYVPLLFERKDVPLF